MKLTIQQAQNEINGRKRIKLAAFIASWDFDLYITIEGSYFTERGKRTNRGVKIN